MEYNIKGCASARVNYLKPEYLFPGQRLFNQRCFSNIFLVRLLLCFTAVPLPALMPMFHRLLCYTVHTHHFIHTQVDPCSTVWFVITPLNCLTQSMRHYITHLIFSYHVRKDLRLIQTAFYHASVLCLSTGIQKKEPVFYCQYKHTFDFI